jgi:hypothetical protein
VLPPGYKSVLLWMTVLIVLVIAIGLMLGPE